MQIDNQQYNEYSFDRICKIQLYDEKKILIDNTLLEIYQKYKCYIFIDFEYTCMLELHALTLML